MTPFDATTAAERERDELNRVARLLKDEWFRIEREEGINVSFISNFVDMARVVIADHDQRLAAARAAAQRERDEARGEVERLHGVLADKQQHVANLLNTLNQREQQIFAWRNWSDEVAAPFGDSRDRSDDGQRKSIVEIVRTAQRERDSLRHLVKRINEMLHIPAAEYVPAISDVFALIDAHATTKEQP